MPFTLSHTAVIIPLYKKFGHHFVLSALVIGCIVPDLFSVFPLGISRYTSHTFAGIFYINIPTGLGLYYVFHTLLSPVIYTVLPRSIQQRLNPNLARFRLKKIALLPIVFSLAIGVLTHILWDGFTHETGIFVQYFEILKTPLITVDGQQFKCYRLLQHLSSLIGLIIILYWVKKWSQKPIPLKKTRPIFSKKLVYLSQISLFYIPFISGTYYGYSKRNPDVYWLYDLQFFARHGIIAAIAFFLIAWFLLAVMYKVYFLHHN